MENEKGLTIFNGEAPPTSEELRLQVDNIKRGLNLWKYSVRASLPSYQDKIQFLSVMDQFQGFFPPLTQEYYGLVEALYNAAEAGKARPDIWPVSEDFLDVVRRVKQMKDVKKKWWKHKKPNRYN